MQTKFKISVVLRSAETIRTVKDGEPRTSTSIFTQLLSSVTDCSSSVLLYVLRDHKDCLGGEPRTSTSIFTQLLSSVTDCSNSVLLYVLRDHKDCWGGEPRIATSTFTQLLNSDKDQSHNYLSISKVIRIRLISFCSSSGLSQLGGFCFAAI